MHFSRPLLRSTAGAALVVAGAAWLDAPAWASSSPAAAVPPRATVLSAIGNTPLVELESLTRLMGGRARIFAKLESQNPGGSIKDPDVIAAADRLGLAMVFTGRRHFRH